eukprot:7191175-Prorocentrum_lima.AAC.1
MQSLYMLQSLRTRANFTDMFVNYEVVARNTKFHSTTQRRDRLLQAFARSSPQVLVGLHADITRVALAP